MLISDWPSLIFLPKLHSSLLKLIDWLIGRYAGPELWRRMLLQCSITIVFTHRLLFFLGRQNPPPIPQRLSLTRRLHSFFMSVNFWNILYNGITAFFPLSFSMQCEAYNFIARNIRISFNLNIAYFVLMVSMGFTVSVSSGLIT